MLRRLALSAALLAIGCWCLTGVVPPRFRPPLAHAAWPGSGRPYAPSASSLLTSLKAYWKFDEDSGYTTADATGNGLTGTLNSASWTTGKINYAVNFTGTVSVGLGTNTAGTATNGAPAITLAGWVKYSSLTGGQYDNTIFASWIDATHSAVLLNLRGDGGNAGKVSCGGRSKTADSYQVLSSATALSPGTFYYVACILNFAAGTIEIDINNSVDATGSASFGSTTFVVGSPTRADTIGMTNGSAYLTGVLDEWGLWGRAVPSPQAYGGGGGDQYPF